MPTDTAPRRQRGSRPLAALVEPCLKPAFARHGFGEADLLLGWPDIVGGRLAGRCEPLRLQWPRAVRDGTQEPATLVVRVEGPFAIELQHQAAVVIERINAHCGWRLVGRIVLRQGPLGPRPPARTRPAPPTPEAVARARAQTAAVADPALRDALTRLGARVGGG